MEINFTSSQNTLYCLLIVLWLGLYGCKKEILLLPEISNLSGSVIIQDSRVYFEYDHNKNNTSTDWNIAIVLSSNSTGRIIKVLRFKVRQH